MLGSAILRRDYNRMLELGGNIYYAAKLGATDGHSFQHLAAVIEIAVQDIAQPHHHRPTTGQQQERIDANQRNIHHALRFSYQFGFVDAEHHIYPD